MLLVKIPMEFHLNQSLLVSNRHNIGSPQVSATIILMSKRAVLRANQYADQNRRQPECIIDA